MPQSGFNLIELITVIVVLGILSAFALPRFAGLEAHARTASLEGLAGSDVLYLVKLRPQSRVIGRSRVHIGAALRRV